MIRLALLSSCVFSLLHASRLPHPSETMKHVERQKREYASQTAWSYDVPEVAEFYGMSTCQDLELLSADENRGDAIKDILVAQHNDVRARFNAEVEAKSCPERKIDEAFLTLEWDTNLAALAQLWANMCTWGHGYMQTRCSFDENYYGQNVYWNVRSYESAFELMTEDAVKSWEELEKPYLDECSGNCVTGQVCGHYEQLIHPSITRVGCAFTDECHACTKIYYQDDTIVGPIDTQYELYFGDQWPTYQAMHVCVYI